MSKIFLLLIIILFVSCGKNTIEEDHVCFVKSDCLSGYECQFDLENGKTYGKCIQQSKCKTDEDCTGNLFCNEDKKCTSVKYEITTTELDTAERGKDYSFQIQYIGLKEGNFYFETVDELPKGLSLSQSGIVSGIPEVLGEFTFAVRLYGHSLGEKKYFNKNYVEKLLKIKIDGEMCDPNPCTEQNKTVCTPNEDNSDYTCSCDEGFVELNGECVADICHNPENPCTEAHKTVCNPNEDNSDYTCSCDEGYYLSENDECLLDYCKDNPCTEENRTKCVNDTEEENGYRCECSEGLIEYDGTCIEDVCNPNPCHDSLKNICEIDLNEENNYKCLCKSGFYEAEDGNCYYDSCLALNNPCAANTSTFKTQCINIENSYECICDERYDTDENGNCFYNPCKINRCREPHKSVCVPTGTGEQDFTCNCDEGYTLTPDNKCYPLGDLCEDAIEASADTQYSGTTDIMHADYVATCGSYAQSKDVVYKFTTTEPKLITVNLNSSEDDPHHVVVHIKDSCERNSNQIACSDRDGDNLNSAKIDKVYIEAGTYYIFIDGYSVDNNGAYDFTYTFSEPCFEDSDCNDDTLFCDTQTHICKENKCLDTNVSCSHGTCNRLDATCLCDEGYINSDNYTCIPDPCHNTQCTENSTCKVTEDLQHYTCECNENFIKTNNGTCVQNPCTPTNTCTQPHKTRCSYNILDDTVETICSCDAHYLDDGNGNCIASIADTCPGVTIPFGTLLTGSTTELHNNYYAKNSYSSEKAKGKDAVYNFKLNKRSHVTITMSPVGNNWDQFLHLRKNNCGDINAQISYSDTYSGRPEIIEEDLDAGIYYVFADGYLESSQGEFSIIVQAEPLCETDNDCDGEHQACNMDTGRCICETGFEFGNDSQCYEKCMQFGEELICSNPMYECLSDNLCHKKTECEPSCQENSHCNTDTLTCVCDDGFVENENGECVVDLCLQNSVTCDGPNVSCNGLTGTCVCDEGYQNYIEGQGCSKDDNPCTPLAGKCEEPNKNICIPTGVNDGEFVCECNEGYIENTEGICINNPCEPNPCGENTVCTLENYHSVCSCKDGYAYDENNICREIEGNSCSKAIDITLNDFTDTISDDLTNSQSFACISQNYKDKVYRFELETDTNLSISLTTNDFNYILGLSSGCNNNFNEISCSQSPDNLNLSSGTYYLYVKADNSGDFSLDFTVNESIYLLRDTLKDAVLNKQYNEKIEIRGGTSPYSVELKPGETLPQGLTLSNGYITGTPTQEIQNANFKIEVTDANNTTKEFTINLSVLDNTQPLAPKKGDLLINEIYFKVTSDANNDGITDINDDEFIEIVNTSYKNLSLEGLSIWDSLDYSYRHRFSGTLDSGQAIVIFGGGDLSSLSSDNVIFVKASSQTLSLKNTGDKVRIMDANDNELESVTYQYTSQEGSINRNPDLTNGDFAIHSEVSDSSLEYSPGKKANGDDF